MKLVLLLSLLSFASTGMAATSAQCELVNGIYQNSHQSLTDLRMETLVDIFTLNNAKAVVFKLEGEELRFIRTDMEVKRQTKMIYLLRKNRTATRAIHLMIDRTPKEVSRSREFYGNMIISPETSNFRSVLQSNLNYNFYCRF